MRDPEGLLCLTMQLPLVGCFAAPALLAYVGLGPDFLPYFAAFLSLAGAALIAVVQWPIVALLGWLKRKRGPLDDSAAQPAVAAGSGVSTDDADFADLEQ